MKRASRSALLIWPTVWLGILVLGGCGQCTDSTKKPPPKPVEPDTMPRAVNLNVQPWSKPMPELPQTQGIRLEAPGTGAKRVYRYRVDAATRELVISARTRTRELANGTWTPELELPELSYGVALGPVPEQPEAGSLALYVRGLEARVGELTAKDPAQAEQIRELGAEFLARFQEHVERRRGTVVFDERGQYRELTLSPDITAKEQPLVKQELLQILLESVVPLPEEPIGKGARWEAKVLLRRGPGVVSQTATYELVEATKDRLRIAATITQLGEHQTLAMSGPADNPVGAELVALFWQARGELELMPGSTVLPITGTLDIELRVHTRAIQGQGFQDYFFETMGKVALSSK